MLIKLVSIQRALELEPRGREWIRRREVCQTQGGCVRHREGVSDTGRVCQIQGGVGQIQRGWGGSDRKGWGGKHRLLANLSFFSELRLDSCIQVTGFFFSNFEKMT